MITASAPPRAFCVTSAKREGPLPPLRAHFFFQQRDVWVRGRYDHVTPLLIELNWSPVSQRIVLLTFKALNGLVPMYIIDPVGQICVPRSLRSLSRGLVNVPQFNSKYGDRYFYVCAPTLWNGLPDH